jgi:hypothetical protein
MNMVPLFFNLVSLKTAKKVIKPIYFTATLCQSLLQLVREINTHGLAGWCRATDIRILRVHI